METSIYLSAFSAIFVLKENGTQSHSAKFLNWGDPTYPPTENDQYKHLSNVSEMIVLIILGSTHQMSILNGLAHQLYTLMADV